MTVRGRIVYALDPRVQFRSEKNIGMGVAQLSEIGFCFLALPRALFQPEFDSVEETFAIGSPGCTKSRLRSRSKSRAPSPA